VLFDPIVLHFTCQRETLFIKVDRVDIVPHRIVRNANTTEGLFFPTTIMRVTGNR
jgi:hypothetical protein